MNVRKRKVDKGVFDINALSYNAELTPSEHMLQSSPAASRRLRQASEQCEAKKGVFSSNKSLS